jgi:hypothetical protein
MGRTFGKDSENPQSTIKGTQEVASTVTSEQNNAGIMPHKQVIKTQQFVADRLKGSLLHIQVSQNRKFMPQHQNNDYDIQCNPLSTLSCPGETKEKSCDN